MYPDRIASCSEAATLFHPGSSHHAGQILSQKLRHRLLVELLAPYPGGTVLDVGCGTGSTIRFLGSLGVRCTGIDVEKDHLDVAVARHSHARVVTGSALALPFGDHSYDAVVLNNVLEMIAEPQLAVAEAARVARRCVYIGAFNRISLLAVQRRWQARRMGMPPGALAARLLSIPEIIELLADAGLHQPRWGSVTFLPTSLSRIALVRRAATSMRQVPNPFAAYLGCVATHVAAEVVNPVPVSATALSAAQPALAPSCRA